MTIETYNWASSAHQELHKIVREEIFPIVNQVDAILQNFEIQFLKEAAKFFGDFKFLAKEADDSFAKNKALEFEIERLLKAVGKCKDTSSVSATRNPLSRKLEKENMELEFQVLNYARENAHLKATYKNLFDSIYVSRAQIKTIIASLQNKLQSNIYKNAKLRTQLFKKVSDQKDNTKNTSENTKFSKQPIVENLLKVGKTNALSNPVTSNSVFTPQEPKSENNDKVIAPEMFRINPSKTSREEKQVPNTIRASTRTKPITVLQPHVITKKDVNSNLNGLSSTGVDYTKTRRPQPRSNTKNDRVPSASKSSRSQNKEAEVEEHIGICCFLRITNIYHRHNQKAKVSVKEIQKKYQPKVARPKKVGTRRKSLATPKPRKSRLLLRWSPTSKLFNQEGKLVDSSKSKSKSNGDNGCCSKHMTGNLKLIINFIWKFMRTVRFGNDHVAAILGFSDLQWGKSKRVSHPPKPVPNSRQRLHLLHMNLCGQMRIASINGKWYVLMIVDDYSRYTWVHFLRSKDEAPKVIIKFLKRITVLLQSPVIIIRTDNGTEFKNQVPQQNGVVERRNRTLVEAARTMLIFSRAPLFLWDEEIATAKLDISFLHVFGALCYPKNDREDIGKLGAKGDICFFIGYSADSCAYRVYNHRTKKIMETKNVSFDELSAMAFKQSSSKPGHNCMTSGHISSGLDLPYAINPEKYEIESCDPVGTPMEIKDKLDLDQNGTSVDATKYRSMIGALMYLTSSRPDIVHAACLCDRYQAKPTEKHLKEVKRIFRYLRGTINTGLWYSKDSGFELTGFSDVDYAGCKDTFKSTSGGAQFLREKLLTDYGFHFNKIPIYCDLKSAIAISCNLIQHSRIKHIAVRYHFIKEHVEKGTIELYFVKTDYQLADIFTKALPTDHFNYLVHRLGMRSLSPKELERLAKSQ
nr:hypothetical protein [Tanacetum cinerariifolium]